MKNPQFVNKNFYHIFNRGVEKRDVFQEDGDRVRFIHYLFHFNNPETTPVNLSRLLKMKEVGPLSLQQHRNNTTCLVNIHAFVLMPNHYHILVSQNTDYGISKFMHKIGTGYTMFFNSKYERSGALFQGKYKAVHINNNSYLQYIPHYIHLNPIKLFNERGRTSFIEKANFLENYRWSSYPDYIGKRNFPSVTKRDFILNLFGNSKSYQKDLEQFLKDENMLAQEIPPELLLD